MRKLFTNLVVVGVTASAACNSSSNANGVSASSSTTTTIVESTTTEPEAESQPITADATHDVTMEEGIVYTEAETAKGTVELAADVYRPATEGSFASMFFVHGGGLRHGDP